MPSTAYSVIFQGVGASLVRMTLTCLCSGVSANVGLNAYSRKVGDIASSASSERESELRLRLLEASNGGRRVGVVVQGTVSFMCKVQCEQRNVDKARSKRNRKSLYSPIENPNPHEFQR